MELKCESLLDIHSDSSVPLSLEIFIIKLFLVQVMVNNIPWNEKREVVS